MRSILSFFPSPPSFPSSAISPSSQLKSLGIDNIMRFEWLAPPPPDTMIRSLETLFAIGALDSDARLTRPLGLQLAEIPLVRQEPHIAQPYHKHSLRSLRLLLYPYIITVPLHHTRVARLVVCIVARLALCIVGPSCGVYCRLSCFCVPAVRLRVCNRRPSCCLSCVGVLRLQDPMVC